MQETSLIANQAIEADGSKETNKQLVLSAFKELKYGTKEDIAKHLNVSQETVHKRISDLCKDKLLKETPFKKRAESTGQLQNIWALAGVDVRIAI